MKITLELTKEQVVDLARLLDPEVETTDACLCRYLTNREDICTRIVNQAAVLHGIKDPAVASVLSRDFERHSTETRAPARRLPGPAGPAVPAYNIRDR